MNYPIKELKNKKSFDYMVSVWLKDEWHSDMFSKYNKNQELKDLVMNPNLSNDLENKKRKDLIMLGRGRLFKNLPSDTEWFSVDFGKEDLTRTFLIPLRFMGWTYVITKGTFSIVDAVSGLIENPKSTRDYNSINDISNHIDSINKEIILLASSPSSRFTVIEGNHRAIALARRLMSGDIKDFKVLLGVSPFMKDYEFSIERWR